MPEEIIIDGMEEHAFRRSIEIMLRNGRADEAVDQLRRLLPLYAGEGRILPARLLELGPEQIRLGGWDRLAQRIEDYSRPSIPITAVGIGIGDPEDMGLEPDALGNLRPPLATSYYSDATFPFSEADRADLLEGYSAFGCEWQGDHDRIDDTLSIEGIDDLYGAIARLENQVAASERPDPELLCAGAVGACYLGVMVWQAARRAVMEHGLPRPMAILLVNSDAYPFFDAPVMTCDEYLDDGALQVVEHHSAAGFDEFDAEEAETASLLDLAGLGAHRASTKKMALVLDGAEAHNPLGMADDLVAQAAFDPDSVDISRFLPDAADFRNEPDFEPQAEAEREARHPAATPDDDLAEPAYPVEAAWPAQAGEFAPGDIAPPAGEEPDTPDGAEPFKDPPAVQDEWRPPEWATELPDQRADLSQGESVPATGPAHERAMPWQEPSPDFPFGHVQRPGASRPQPASHAIRARIRMAPQEAEVQHDRAGLVARILAWIGKLLSRR